MVVLVRFNRTQRVRMRLGGLPNWAPSTPLVVELLMACNNGPYESCEQQALVEETEAEFSQIQEASEKGSSAILRQQPQLGAETPGAELLDSAPRVISP